MRVVFFICLLFLLAGCASDPVVDCAPMYDPEARKIPGVVQAKRQASPEKQIVNGKWSGEIPDDVKNHKVVESPAELSAIGPAGGLGAVGGYLLLNALGPKPQCGEVVVENRPTVYEYDVAAEDGNKYRVWSHFPGFEEGQCVNIFLSDKPGQFTPRLASGFSCAE